MFGPGRLGLIHHISLLTVVYPPELSLPIKRSSVQLIYDFFLAPAQVRVDVCQILAEEPKLSQRTVYCLLCFPCEDNFPYAKQKLSQSATVN